MKLGVCLLLLAGCGGAPFTAAGPDLLERDGAPDVATAEGGPQEDGGGGEGDALADGEGGQVEAGAEACVPVTHDDGIGQTWQDCTPAGTYTRGEAEAACRANGGSPCVQNDCSGSGQAVCDIDPRSPGYCSCWVYVGPLAGHVNNSLCTDAGQVAQASCVGSDTWQ